MEPREKNTKRVAQAKRLAAFNRERFAWMKEERRKQEEEEGLPHSKEKKKENKKNYAQPPTFFSSPRLRWRLWGLVFCGTFESLRKRKRRNNQNQDREFFKDQI